MGIPSPITRCRPWRGSKALKRSPASLDRERLGGSGANWTPFDDGRSGNLRGFLVEILRGIKGTTVTVVVATILFIIVSYCPTAYRVFSRKLWEMLRNSFFAALRGARGGDSHPK